MADSVRIKAPAKLNLALSVGAAGADRMHPICSWMITVDFYDELLITRREDPPLSLYAVEWHEDAVRKPEIDWPISADLGARAHQALESHVGRSLPVRMKVSKRIPTGSGLGGGSSDAAAVLKGTNELFDLGLGEPELCELGAGLGSDIPFLLKGGSAIVEGLGEQVVPDGSLPEFCAVLVLPDQHCDTGRVYGWFDDLSEEGAPPGLRPEEVRALSRGPLKPSDPFNDLTVPAMRVAPDLRRLMEDVSRVAERPVHLTGSGAALFVICDESIHAEALAGAIQGELGEPALAVSSVAAPPPVRD